MSWADEAIHQALRRQEIQDSIVKMLVEPEMSRRRAEALIRKRLHRPRLGTAQGEWEELIACIVYMIYDELKQIYGYKHLFDVTDQEGVVMDVPGYYWDGDFLFDIHDINPEWDYRGKHWVKLHCEITPCDQRDLQAFIDKLQAEFRRLGPGRIRVRLDGTLTWDATHCGSANQLEIHPVTDAQIL